MIIRKPVTIERTEKILKYANNYLSSSLLNTKDFKVAIINNFFLNNKLNIIVFLSVDKFYNYFFYILDENLNCICYCEFINQKPILGIYKLKKMNKNVYTPHCTISKKYTKCGIGTNIYKFFLTKLPNTILITEKHTRAAKSLWEKVAKNIDGEIIYHNLVTGKTESCPTKTNIKLLVLK